MDFMNSFFGYGAWRESEIDDMIIDFIEENKYRRVPAYEVDAFLQNNHLDYQMLTPKQKALIDEIDVF